jgi:hypothetical protein
VVGYGDPAEAPLVGGLRNPCQRSAKLRGAAVPDIVVELKREFHMSLPLYNKTDAVGTFGLRQSA